jgi:hypothetical protein
MALGHSITGGQAAGREGQKAGAMSTPKSTPPKFRTWRIVVPVLLATFAALMCAGPGSVAVPNMLSLFARAACPAGQHAALPTVAPVANPQVQTVYCVDEAGVPTDATRQFFGVSFAGYFIVFAVPLLLVGLTMRFGSPRVARPLGADAERELRRLMAAGRQLEAVKYVQNRLGVSRRAARDYVQQLAATPEAPAEPAAAPTPAPGVLERLKQLKQLLETDLISKEEYEAKRFDILAAL